MTSQWCSQICPVNIIIHTTRPPSVALRPLAITNRKSRDTTAARRWHPLIALSTGSSVDMDTRISSGWNVVDRLYIHCRLVTAVSHLERSAGRGCCMRGLISDHAHGPACCKRRLCDDYRAINRSTRVLVRSIHARTPLSAAYLLSSTSANQRRKPGGRIIGQFIGHLSVGGAWHAVLNCYWTLTCYVYVSWALYSYLLFDQV